ncbi:G-protein coupled receptor daf-37-like [Tigriopus californicus]|uniref:G-protein coupled receptor daf-37-like n=1 Tax=Tigriopus californicus TaxID=6832 RepID=UPI0027DA35D2|nr:G-protein coupled receptor daf-37-like [Tigriopus californicus]XP_059082322.1 G-protein coupled receptor daf-37-like [Tigriopus californicus]XP_059082323.1 G-protein coupled receptor daf-37-like [Tigriopus californicus]
MTWNNSSEINFIRQDELESHLLNLPANHPGLDGGVGLDPILTLRFVTEGLVNSVVSTFGLVGNVSAIVILATQKLDLHSFLRHILIALAVFDIIFLVTTFFLYSLPLFSSGYHDHFYQILAPKLLIPLSQIALTGSVYSIITITIERYLATCRAHLKTTSPPRTSVIAIVAIVTFACIYNAPRFLEYATQLQSVKYQDYYLGPSGRPVPLGKAYSKLEHRLEATEFRTSSCYILLYLLFGNGLFMTFGPIAVLAVLNWNIHKAIRLKEQRKALLMTSNAFPQAGHPLLNPARSFPGATTTSTTSPFSPEASDEKDLTITKILFGIVAVFVICHIFKMILVTLEVIFNLFFGTNLPASMGIEILMTFNHMALVFNSSINVFIYIHKDKHFRNAAKAFCQLPNSIIV